ncbi:rhodanese-like domain-containing protein [Carboxylicivirga sp. N1Y90]|uniref:rhodanese-like domain-containing protein n=1 Tax=Carboxylicivirga fragile TaxID=3417571 RepID=UPI003D33FE40|nr:rhodanese-like domain-containing protein [Marinilabiliaceae bacterium N1Y90]
MSALKMLFITLGLLGIIHVEAQSSKSRINAQEFHQKLNENKGAIIIDARPSFKFAEDRIRDAILAEDQKTLELLIQDLPKHDPIFVYCQIGDRSKKALKVMKNSGFTEVYELKDGLVTWIEAGLPLDTIKLNR